MSYQEPRFRRIVSAGFMVILFLTVTATLTHASGNGTTFNKKDPKWVRSLPSASCPGTSSTYCHRSSPVLADLTGDGKLEIVAATNKGFIAAFSHDGSRLWQTDIAAAFGMSSGKQVIASSPAVADIDGDGRMEIVVGTGSVYPSLCSRGGVIVLNHNGRVQPGWPFITRDISVAPSGCPDTVYATPALGDLDQDGTLEIIFGAFDHSVYALHHDGRPVAGFPPNSHLYKRFGWPELQNRLADTIWSSPALADIDGDGFLDVVIGSDEGNFDASHNPPSSNWTCPYREPIREGYCGGSIYAFDRRGQQLEGFPRYIHETVQSTPAVMDVDEDGRSEIFWGTGSWYHRMSPDHPTLGFRLFGTDSKGNDLPGWQGGKVTGGYVAASPSIGDITGDGQPNIVVAASDQRLYAWSINGQAVAGFPMTPRTRYNQVLDRYDVGTGFILADYTGDGKMEILLRHAWEIVIVNGKGRQLTASNANDSRPVFVTKGTIMNNPAVADLDGDGHLELVVQNSELTVWDLPNSSTKAQWPMFKKNAARTSSLEPKAWAEPQELRLVVGQDQSYKQSMELNLYGNVGTFAWRASSDQPSRIDFAQDSGLVEAQKTVIVNVDVPAGLSLGENHIGNIKVTFTRANGYNQTEFIPVKATVLRRLYQSYSPLVR